MRNFQPFRFLQEAPSALDWLAYLRSSHGINPQTLAHIGKQMVAIDRKNHNEAPLYLRALTGIGALVSGFLLLFVLYSFGLFSLDKENLSINGFALIAVAALLHRFGSADHRKGQDFYLQLALTLLQVGKIALVAGLVQIADDLLPLRWYWTMTLILGFVAVISFIAFRSSIERWLSATAFLFALWISVALGSADVGRLVLFNLLLSLHLLALAAFLRLSALRRHLTSLYDALLISLCFAVGVIASIVHIGDQGLADMPANLDMLAGFGFKGSVLVALCIALLGLVRWIAPKGSGAMGEPMLAAGAGIVLLGLLSDPGILLALGLMILGYATHRPAHSLLGLVFALLFGFFYYYSLDLTLLQKSMILVASGALLLIGSSYIYWRGWYKEKADA